MTQVTPPAEHQLQRNSISTIGVVFFVLAAASPLIGLTGAVPAAMVIGNGLGTPLAYITIGIIELIFAAAYVAMSRRVTNAGALYAYVGRGLGVRLGLGAGAIAFWAYLTIQAAVYGFFGAVFSGALAGWFGIELSWWVVTLILIALVQVFGFLHVEVGARVLGVLMFLEWGTILVMCFLILIKGGGPEGLAAGKVFSLDNLTSGAPGVALMFAVASMFGFEATALYSEEVRNPKRAIPRATYWSIAAIMGFFAFTSWMLIAAYGPSKAIDAAAASLGGNPADYTFTMGAKYLGSWAPDLLTVFVVTSMFACTLAFHNSIARYLFTFGRDGVLPKALGKVHPKTRSPYIASFTQTALVLLLLAPFVILGKDPVLVVFFWFSGISVVGIITLWVLVALAVLVHFSKEPSSDASPLSTKVAPVLSGILLGWVGYLVLKNFDTLVGATGATSLFMILTVPTAFIIGLILFSVRESKLSSTAIADLDSEYS